MSGGTLLLAAGFGRRFGADKRRQRLADGTPLLLASVARYGAIFPAVTVVLRPEDDDLAHDVLALPSRAALRVERCAEAVEGMGRSLACGAAACRHWTYLFVALGDMPWVREETLARLLAAMTDDADPQRIVIPEFRGKPGHPVGFGAAHLPALAALGGDSGARAVVQASSTPPLRVDVDDAGVLRDVDRPEDLAAPG